MIKISKWKVPPYRGSIARRQLFDGLTAPGARLCSLLRPPAGSWDVADAALAMSREIFYASHNWQPLFAEGTKTLAFELWEQLGFRAPDNVVVPVGYGSNVLGCNRGFSELLRRGEIDRMPRLFGVQATNCAPYYAAFRAGVEHLVPAPRHPHHRGGHRLVETDAHT